MVKKILKRKKLENNIYILGYSLDMADEDNSQRAMKDAFLKIFLSDKIMRTGMIQINMLEILKQVMESNFVGALIGGFCTLIGSIWVWKSQSKEQEKHAASMLYYDLCSIENYLRNERSSVNIRYSVEWQKMVSSCAFLPLDVMEKIYNIYEKEDKKIKMSNI